MNSILNKTILLGLLLMFVVAPFAGFAPLLLVILIAGVCWFVSSIFRVLIFGEDNEVNNPTEVAREE